MDTVTIAMFIMQIVVLVAVVYLILAFRRSSYLKIQNLKSRKIKKDGKNAVELKDAASGVSVILSLEEPQRPPPSDPPGGG